ncbi:PilZ domain-containing protein [Thalassomonas sp. RHCl1]|uniref:flagellar brake protein n=1 Tax=Thalassomonas sp. RHCl1 TaxID=2995320 RepID=UPI00248C33B1|nr:PilZ domain-containing protein [Thalassomonas sp. RHCl1]
MMAAIKIPSIDNHKFAVFNKMSPGCSLTVQVNAAQTIRFSSQLIGYEMGSYLLITLPAGAKDKYHNTLMVSGYEVVIRALLDGGLCLAFSCPVESLVSYPHEFLVLSFPKHIETCQLRKHPRAATCISAMIENTGFEQVPVINGCIQDISLGGCCFVFDMPAKVKDVHHRKLMVNLGDQQHSVGMLAGEVRNQRKQQTKIRLGIAFDETTSQVAALCRQLHVDLAALR